MANQSLDKIKDYLNGTLFFSGELLGNRIESNDYLANISLSAIPFRVRFLNVLKTTNLISLLDLLNCDFKKLLLLRNCGINSIEDAKINIYEFIMNTFGLENFDKVVAGDLERESCFSQASIYIPFLGSWVTGIADGFNELKEIKITKLELPTRFRRFLQTQPRIKTIGNLIEMESTRLSLNQNLGKQSIKEAQETLTRLISNDRAIKQLQNERVHILDLVENYLDKIDSRTKNIFSMRWGMQDTNSLEEIGIKNNLTRERIRQIIFSKLKKLDNIVLQNRDFYLDYFLNLLMQELKPLSYDHLETDKSVKRKYAKKLFVGILVELFPEVAFEEFEPKSFRQYLSRYLPKDNRYAHFYHELKSVSIPFGEVHILRLFEMLKANSVKDKLILLYTILNLDEYNFCSRENKPFFLVRKGSLHDMARDILEGSEKPLGINELLNLIRECYKQHDNKYFTLPAVVSNLKNNNHFFQLDRYTFGLERHFGYCRSEWGQICEDVKKIMQEIKRQTNVAEIHDMIKFRYPKIKSKYELAYILRADNEIVDLGFFNYSLSEFGFEERIKITDAIKSLFEADPMPKHFSEIQKKISEKRFIRIEGMNNILKAQNYLFNYHGGFWGLRNLHNNNLQLLAASEQYLFKIVSYETFPDTTLGRVSEYFFEKFDEETIKSTIKNGSLLYLCEDVDHNDSFIIAKCWSPAKITRCILFNLNRPVFWDELSWIFSDIGVQLDSNCKHKINNDKNIHSQDNKLTYFAVSLDDKDATEVVNICYEMLKSKEGPSLIDNICDLINREFIELTKKELIYLLEKDDRFLIVDEQLIMVT